MQILRPKWLDLILLAALASLVFYVKVAPNASPGSPWSDLWPNAVVDLFSIWLTARVIQGILDHSQKRRNIYNGFRGGLNFITGHLRDLLPHVDGFRMRILEDELRWFNLRLDRQGKYLRPEHRTRVQDALRRADSIVTMSDEFRSFRREANRYERRMEAEFDRSQDRIAETPPMHKLLWLRDLHDEVRDLGKDAGDSANLAVQVDEARRMQGNVIGTDELRQEIGLYLAAVQGMIDRYTAIRGETEKYVKFIRDNEISLLDSIGD